MALLWEGGTVGVECRPPASGLVELLAYFEDGAADSDVTALERRLARCRVESAPVPDVDWVCRFRSSFHAFTASGFRIAPPWETGATAGDERLIVVDPGRAFGTGTHETTRLCLASLVELARRRPLGRVLDVGTGTGILAVAARKLGAELCVGVDVDADAVAAAAQHAALNGVDLRLVRGDGTAPLRTGGFDVVLANLSAALLHGRRDEILAACAPRGTLLLSGLLVEDLADLAAAYHPFGALQTRIEAEWAALVVDLT